MESRQLKEEKEEAEKFNAMLQNRHMLHTEFFLWQLFHVNTDINEKEDIVDDLRNELENARNEANEKSEALKEAKKEASVARRATAATEKVRVKHASEVDVLQPSIIKSSEEVKSLKRKVTANTKGLDKARTESDSHGEILGKLEKEISEYEDTDRLLKDEYDEVKKTGSQGQVLLTEEQEAEYEKIREAAAVASAKPRQILNSENRKLDSAKSNATAVLEELNELKSKRNEAIQNAKELTERRDKLQEVCFFISEHFNFLFSLHCLNDLTTEILLLISRAWEILAQILRRRKKHLI